MLKEKLKTIFKNSKGFSLVEVLVALLLLSIIATTFLNVFLTSFDLSMRAQDITNYTYAAQAYVEELRVHDYRELVDYSAAHNTREEFDTNDDGTPDCYVELTVEPYGSCDRGVNCEDATYVHLIYFVSKVMIVAGDGVPVYTNGEEIRTVNSITLEVQSDGRSCVLKAGGQTVEFNRKSASSPVILMANLDLKDFGYDNKLSLYGDIGDIDVKVYGNEVIVKEFFIDSDVNPGFVIEEYCGIFNISTSLVRMEIELFEEADSTEAFFEMSEIVEIYNGEKDSLLDP